MSKKLGDLVVDKKGLIGRIIDLWKLPDGTKMATLLNKNSQYVRTKKEIKKVHGYEQNN